MRPWVNFGYPKSLYRLYDTGWFIAEHHPSPGRLHHRTKNLNRIVAVTGISVLWKSTKRHDTSIAEGDQGGVPASTAAPRSIGIRLLEIGMDIHIGRRKPGI
jgi:hypothetical protein